MKKMRDVGGMTTKETMESVYLLRFGTSFPIASMPATSSGEAADGPARSSKSLHLEAQPDTMALVASVASTLSVLSSGWDAPAMPHSPITKQIGDAGGRSKAAGPTDIALPGGGARQPVSHRLVGENESQLASMERRVKETLDSTIERDRASKVGADQRIHRKHCQSNQLCTGYSELDADDCSYSEKMENHVMALRRDADDEQGLKHKVVDEYHNLNKDVTSATV